MVYYVYAIVSTIAVDITIISTKYSTIFCINCLLIIILDYKVLHITSTRFYFCLATFDCLVTWHVTNMNVARSPPVERWNQLLEHISEQLRSSKALLGLWQRYKSLYSQCAAAVQKQEERADRLLKSATDRDITAEESSAWIKDCSVSAYVASFSFAASIRWLIFRFSRLTSAPF